MPAKKKNESKAVAKTNAGAVGKVVDYGEDAGAGFENQTNDDISIPFIDILQSNSPQVSDDEDAIPGKLFNTVTGQYIDPEEGILFVPATTKHAFVEWVPRDDGGGFVALHEIDSDVVKQAKANAKEKFKYKNGKNDLVETFYVYGMVVDPETNEASEMAVLAFRSTKIKIYRRWNTSVKMFTVRTPDGRKVNPPLFAHLVKVSSYKDKNKKGVYFNFDLSPANKSIADSLLPPGDPRLEAAKGLKDLVDSGVASAAHGTEGAAGTTEEGGESEEKF